MRVITLPGSTEAWCLLRTKERGLMIFIEEDPPYTLEVTKYNHVQGQKDKQRALSLLLASFFHGFTSFIHLFI